MNISWQQIWCKNSNTGVLNSVLKVVEETASCFRRKQVCIYCVSKEKLTFHISVYHSKTDHCKCTVGNLGSTANG